MQIKFAFMLIGLFCTGARADASFPDPQKLRAEAYKVMNNCLRNLPPKQRELPSTCNFNECDANVRLCWYEGMQVVDAQTQKIEDLAAEPARSNEKCSNALKSYFDYRPLDAFEQRSSTLEGPDFEYKYPPNLRGDAGLLDSMMAYELAYIVYRKNCRKPGLTRRSTGMAVNPATR
ncbi:hypothetical protein EKL02_16825 [Janthinobacterium sp. 17J80-10]|nr:hypothetical protein EKL02_16825 [Janthinobacterium sp. 17J80-10]